MSTEAPPAPPQTGTPPPTPPASGVQAPWASSWIKPDFTLDHSALERLPDHLRGMKDTLSKYKTLEETFTGFQSLQAMAGKKALAPLPADAPESVRAERKQLIDAINGVPADTKGYGLAKPQDLPEHVWNQGLADKAATWAHKHSVSPAALKELVFDINGGAVKEMLQSQAQQETQFWTDQDTTFKAHLQRENIPADRASALVEKGAIALGLDLKDEGTQTFLKGSNARLMAMKHAMAIGEDKGMTTGNANNGGAMDPMQSANDILNNPANPLHAAYWNKGGKYSRADSERARETASGFFRQASEQRERDQAGKFKR